MMMNRLVDPGLILLSRFFLKKHQFVTRGAVAVTYSPTLFIY